MPSLQGEPDTLGRRHRGEPSLDEGPHPDARGGPTVIPQPTAVPFVYPPAYDPHTMGSTLVVILIVAVMIGLTGLLVLATRD